MFRCANAIFVLIICVLPINSTQDYANLDSVSSSLEYEQMNWNDIVQSEDFIINALEKLKKDLHISPKDTENYTTSLTLAAPSVTTTATRSGPTKIKSSKAKTRKVLDILLYGTNEELKNVTRRKIIKVMPTIENILIPLDKKLILWEIIKQNMTAKHLNATDLQYAEPLLNVIPENDLYQLNLTDNDLLYYLGTHKNLTRRKIAILAYSLKNSLALNSSLMLQIPMLNSLRGLLCGYSNYDLSKINSSEFWTINDDVFNNLWACSIHQLNTIYEVCKKEYEVAHLELWNEMIIKKLGFLLQVVPPYELPALESKLFKHISDKTFMKLDAKQLKELTPDQVKHLTTSQANIYNVKR